MATKVITLAEGGVPAKSLDQVSVVGKGQTLAVPQRHSQHAPGPREVTWGTKMGDTDPTDLTVNLLVGYEVNANGDILNPTTLDSTTDATGELKTIVVGKFPLLQIDLAAITIGPGDPLDGVIMV